MSNPKSNAAQKAQIENGVRRGLRCSNEFWALLYEEDTSQSLTPNPNPAPTPSTQAINPEPSQQTGKWVSYVSDNSAPPTPGYNIGSE